MAGKQAAGVPVVRIRTDRGVIRFVLLERYAHGHAANMIKLVEQGFYDGLVFHRVVPNVLIQGGDPEGTGRGGPGYTIKAEFNERPHVVGAVGMARTSDPDSGGSQFYICLTPMPHLNGQYTIFGHVIEGLEVAAAVQKGDRMHEVVIERVPKDELPAGALD